jgi:outer membrane protein
LFNYLLIKESDIYATFVFYVFLIIIVFSGSVYAKTDLKALMTQAIKSDPRILSSMAEIRASKSEVDGAYSVYYPVVRGNSSYGTVENEDPLQRDGDKQIYGLEIEQPLPLFGRETAVVNIARVGLRIKEMELKQVRQAVFLEVLETALNLQAKQSMLQLRESMVENLFTQSGHLKESVAGGGAKLNEFYLAQSEWIQMQVSKAQAQTDYNAVLEKLRSLAPGILFDSGITSVDFNALGLQIPDQLQQALVDSISLSPSLRLAQYALDKAQAELVVARASVWPQLSLKYAIQRGSFGDAPADSQTLTIGLNGSLYEGGASSARLTTAAHQAAAAREQLFQQRRIYEQQIKETWLRWKSASRMVEVLALAEQQVQELVAATRLQVASGASTVIGELSTSLIVFETQIKVVEQQLLRDVALVQLLHQLGTLVLPVEQ